METKHEFCTGVRVSSGAKLYGEFQRWSSNGVKMIDFYCEDVPTDAVFFLACNEPNMYEKEKDIKAFKIIRGGLLSEYAYFIVK